MAADDGQRRDELDFERLSPREREILRLVAQSLQSKEIARLLGLSPKTVEMHVLSARRRLGGLSRRDAALTFAAWEGGRTIYVPVPAPRPAAVAPAWRDGQIDIVNQPESPTLNSDTALAALTFLRAALEKLAQRLSRENISRGEVELVRNAALEVPGEVPDPASLFALGHTYTVLESLTDTAKTEWSASSFAEFAATLIHFDRLLKQFPSWKTFIANAENQPDLSAELPLASQAARELADALAEIQDEDALRKPLAAPALVEAFQLLGSDRRFKSDLPPNAAKSPAYRDLLTKDIIESIGNTLKTIAQAASRYAGAIADGFKAEAIKQADKDGVRAFHWLRRAVGLGLLGLGGGALGDLVASHPAHFAWLARVVKFIIDLMP